MDFFSDDQYTMNIFYSEYVCRKQPFYGKVNRFTLMKYDSFSILFLMHKHTTSLSASVKLSMRSFRQMELRSASTAKRSSKNVLSGLHYFWNRWPAEMLALLRTQHAVQHPFISSTFWKHGIKYSVPSKISRSFMYCTLEPTTEIRVISCF